MASGEVASLRAMVGVEEYSGEGVGRSGEGGGREGSERGSVFVWLRSVKSEVRKVVCCTCSGPATLNRPLTTEDEVGTRATDQSTNPFCTTVCSPHTPNHGFRSSVHCLQGRSPQLGSPGNPLCAYLLSPRTIVLLTKRTGTPPDPSERRVEQATVGTIECSPLQHVGISLPSPLGALTVDRPLGPGSDPLDLTPFSRVGPAQSRPDIHCSG